MLSGVALLLVVLYCRTKRRNGSNGNGDGGVDIDDGRMQQQQQQRPATVALTANAMYAPAMNNAYDAGVCAHGPATDSNVVYAVAIDEIDGDSGGSAAYYSMADSICNGDADASAHYDVANHGTGACEVAGAYDKLSAANAHYDVADHGTGACEGAGAYDKLSARPPPSSDGGSGSGSGSGGYETSA